MRKVRSNILLLAVTVGALTFGRSAWLAVEGDQAAKGGPFAASKANAGVRFMADVESGSAQSAAGSRVEVVQETKTVEALSADASMLVATMCDLQLMAAGSDLPLGEKDWPVLADVVMRNQAIQHTYEAQIATVRAVAPGRYRAEIPAYADAGEELRERFAADLRAELGEPAAGVVLAKLGARLEARFAGFGLSVQTLDITVDPAGGLDDVQIARVATYWDSVDGRNRLSTRREIYFPKQEDLTGDNWAALLAKVSAAGAES